MTKPLRRVGSYPRAIAWIISNDDTEWLKDEEPIMSVTAALIADIFGRTDAEVIADLRKELEREVE